MHACTYVRMYACVCLCAVCCLLFTVEQVQAEGAQPVVVCECLGLGVTVPCRMRRRIHCNCASSTVPEDRVKRRSKIHAGAQWLVWHSRPCSHGCIPSGWACTQPRVFASVAVPGAGGESPLSRVARGCAGNGRTARPDWTDHRHWLLLHVSGSSRCRCCVDRQGHCVESPSRGLLLHVCDCR
jgi:hypothetical protein